MTFHLGFPRDDMHSPEPIRLILRGDDAGSSRSANLALRECVEHGILRNVSVMAPGPAFLHAVETLNGLDRSHCNVGLHITLSSEWESPRWGPILPAPEAPSLVDSEGYFTASPRVLLERGFVVEEALAEIEAQLDHATEAGLRVDYLDEHMGVSWIDPRLRQGIAALAQRHGLADAHGVPSLPKSPGIQAGALDLAARLEHAIAHAAGGAYLYLAHPTYDDAEMAAFAGAGLAPGEVGPQRNGERRQYLSPEVAELCRHPRIQLVRYRDLA